jgi:hypothetical protein
MSNPATTTVEEPFDEDHQVARSDLPGVFVVEEDTQLDPRASEANTLTLNPVDPFRVPVAAV